MTLFAKCLGRSAERAMGFLFLEFAPPAVQVMEDMKNGELNPKSDLEKFKLQLVDHPLIKGSGWVNVFLF